MTKTTPLNKFEMLSSQVMQCGIEEKVIRRQEVVVVECFKCREKRHKGAVRKRNVGKKSGTRLTMEDTEILWRRHPR